MSAYGRTVVGLHPVIAALGSGNTPATVALAAVNNAAAFRFIAPDARDVASVYVRWGGVSAPGTVRVRVETNDNSSGVDKPSGTLYDANATVDVTPSTAGTGGWQICTFATLPTAGLAAGGVYHVVLITTVGGTSHNLSAYLTPTNGAYPANCLSATDGSTRSNLVENSNSVPCCTLVFEDGAEDPLGFTPNATSSNFTVFGTKAHALKFVVPTGVSFKVAGVVSEGMLRNGTPNDLRCRVLDAANALVTGASVTLPKQSLTTASGRRIRALFPAPVTLAAGTYRAVWDDPTHASTSGNNWQFYSASVRASGLAPTGLALSTTADVTAGSPTWTDTATDQPLTGLVLDDVVGAGGGGGGAGYSRGRVVNAGG